MSIFRLTDVADSTRESKEYWDKRNENLWGKQMHGHFLDDPKLIEDMDKRNFNVLMRHIVKRELESVSVLEAACGIGRYAPVLHDKCHVNGITLDYTGIDFATKNIEEAKVKYEKENACFFESDMLQYKTDKKFDIIFMVAAMSSIEQNSKEIIDHLKTMLTENGVIIIFEQSVYAVIDGVGVKK